MASIDEDDFKQLKELGQALQSEEDDRAFAREVLGEASLYPVMSDDADLEGTRAPYDTLNHDEKGSFDEEKEIGEEHEQAKETTIVKSTLIELPTEARVGKALAIEVLCPTCGGACADPRTGSLMITDELVGHTVTCTLCYKQRIVPLNAFSLAGNVTAREKLATGRPNTHVEKRGRTEKERKSAAGRKTKGKMKRQPLQLSLDIRTITTLNATGVNKSELFEELLHQYEPFVQAWQELGYTESDEDDD